MTLFGYKLVKESDIEFLYKERVDMYNSYFKDEIEGMRKHIKYLEDLLMFLKSKYPEVKKDLEIKKEELKSVEYLQ